MDLRRTQVTRGGTFFITLPKDWALRNGLTRGSLIAASETADGRLILDPKYDVERAPAVATIEPGPYIDREIIGKYLLGYDIIRIEAEDRISLEYRDRIKRSSSKLIGLEIIEEDYSRIVMQCLLEPSALPPEKVLRREHSITSSMHRDAVTALIEGDSQMARSVIARDNEVDRLYFLLVRILRTIIQNPGLSERLEVHPIDCLDYRLVASLVESVGDQSTQIAEQAVQVGDIELAGEVSQSLLNLHLAVHEAYEDAVNAFLLRNISVANSVRDRQAKIEALYDEVESVASTQPAEIARLLLSVASLINRVYDHSVDIADLTMPRLSKST
ncbi:MAG: PhoU family protein [Candidatus Bathyarchaeota archaeon B26-2]|nr:MAG: PhoU family protein [Candidatus Bathyarchaeota archaeon B26-2]